MSSIFELGEEILFTLEWFNLIIILTMLIVWILLLVIGDKKTNAINEGKTS